MKKKILAVLLFAVLTMNLSAVFAKYEVADAPLPDVGVIFYDDMEGYTTVESVRRANGGGWNANLNAVGTVNGDTMLFAEANAGDSILSRTATYSLSAGDPWGYGNVDINTGKLKIEYTAYVPEEGGTLLDGELHRFYVNIYSQAGWNDANLKEQANLSTVMCRVGEKPVVAFAETGVEVRHNDVEVPIEFNTEYTVTTIIDYDAATVGHYLNGELKATYKANSAVPVKQAYKFNYLYPVTDTKVNAGSNPKIYFDDVKIERMGGAAVMTAQIGEVAEHYVDIQCSDTISGEAADFDTSDFAVNVVGALESVHPTSIEKISGGSTLRLTFANTFEAGELYECCINAVITSAFNKNTSLPAGTSLIFQIPMEQQVITLLEQNFDDYTFPTNEATSTEGDMNFFVTTQAGAENKTGTYTDEKKYLYAYISGVDDGNGGKMMQFESLENWGAWARDAISIEIPFAEGQTVTDGVLTVEFDAAVSSDPNVSQLVDYAFGLSDKQDTSMEYSYTNRWANADLYAGLTYWDSANKSFVHANADTAARTWGGMNGDLKTGLITAAGSGSLIKNSATMHKYKFEIDLDNKKYDIYFDGNLVQSLDYLPGSKQQMEYDAFVFTRILSAGEYKPDRIYLDNIKITKLEPAPATVNGMRFNKYDGTVYGYSRTLSAGLIGAEVEFSQEMSTANITVEGLNAADYSVNLDGTKAVVTFADCLAPDTEYAVVVGEDSTSADGKPIAKGIRYAFTTDSGEITYLKPVIKCNGMAVDTLADITADGKITVDVTVVNTTTETTSAFVTLVAHKNNTLVYATALAYAPQPGTPRVNTVTLSAEDAAACAGADAIKVFVFDNLTEMKPLASAEIVE